MSGHYAFRGTISGKITADHILQGSTHMFLIVGEDQSFDGDKTFQGTTTFHNPSAKTVLRLNCETGSDNHIFFSENGVDQFLLEYDGGGSSNDMYLYPVGTTGGSNGFKMKSDGISYFYDSLFVSDDTSGNGLFLQSSTSSRDVGVIFVNEATVRQFDITYDISETELVFAPQGGESFVMESSGNIDFRKDVSMTNSSGSNTLTMTAGSGGNNEIHMADAEGNEFIISNDVASGIGKLNIYAADGAAGSTGISLSNTTFSIRQNAFITNPTGRVLVQIRPNVAEEFSYLLFENASGGNMFEIYHDNVASANMFYFRTANGNTGNRQGLGLDGSGNATFDQNVTIEGDLTLNGFTSFNDPLTLSDTLSLTASTSFDCGAVNGGAARANLTCYEAGSSTAIYFRSHEGASAPSDDFVFGLDYDTASVSLGTSLGSGITVDSSNNVSLSGTLTYKQDRVDSLGTGTTSSPSIDLGDATCGNLTFFAYNGATQAYTVSTTSMETNDLVFLTETSTNTTTESVRFRITDRSSGSFEITVEDINLTSNRDMKVSFMIVKANAPTTASWTA